MRFTRTIQLLAVSTALSGFFPVAGSAQGIRLLPSVGLYVPVSDLGEVRDDGFDGAVELGKMESTLALGLAGEFTGSDGGLGIRGGLAYATSSDIPIEGVGCTTCSARSSLLVVTAALAFRPIPRLIGLQPYLLAGGGIKRYDFDPENFTEEGLDGVLDDQTQGTAQLGLGADFNLGGLGLFAELNGYLSRVEPASGDFDTDSELQTDFVLSVGISLGGD